MKQCYIIKKDTAQVDLYAENSMWSSEKKQAAKGLNSMSPFLQGNSVEIQPAKCSQQ